jgi:hypothetical protein
MGILSDIFVSTPEDAVKYEAILLASQNKLPKDRYERVQYKGLTSLEFARLWAIMDNRPWTMESYWLDNVQHTDDGSSSLDHFPDILVAKLAKWDDHLLSPTADEWGKTEELQSDGATLLPILTDLRRLARVAQQTTRSMYLWNSL